MQFAPGDAFVYAPVRTTEQGVTTTGEQLFFGPTRITTPRGLLVSEKTDNQVATGVSDVVIEIWNHGGCNKLTTDMWIIHDDIRYDIKGPMRTKNASWQAETTAYQCRINNDPQPVVES